MEREVIGKLEIWLMKNGKMPSQVEGMDEYQTINVLSSLISHINKQMAGKDREYWKKWERDEIKQKLYQTLAGMFGTEDPYPIMNALVWCLNRVNLRNADSRHVVVPDLPVAPEVLKKELN